jgi:peptidoglycan-associated lipoprotein
MMRFITVLLCVTMGASRTSAQPTDYEESRRALAVAEDKDTRGDLYNAVSWYERALEDAPKTPYIIHKLAFANYRLRDYEQAQQWYVRLMAADRADEYPEAQFYYARCLKMNGFLDDALYHFELFEQNYKGKYAGLKALARNEIIGTKAAQIAVRDTLVRIKNAGDRVNSPFSEFAPTMVGGTELYYSALRSDSILLLANAQMERKNVAKIYRTVREYGSFAIPEPLDGGINETGQHIGNATLSPSRNTMYYCRCQLANNVLSHCDILRSERQEITKWKAGTPVQGINSSNYTVKQPAWGKWHGKEGLFFVSDKTGGRGGWDLYFAAISPDGSFAQSENLGANINTIGNEETPFYDPTTGYLFFSSDGLPTFGGYDIFSVASTTKPENLAPKNLGRGINSLVDDLYFSVNAEGTQGYLVSNRVGTISLRSQTCCDDIFTLDFPQGYFQKAIAPNSLVANGVTDVKLAVTDDAAHQPLAQATITLRTAAGDTQTVTTNERGEWRLPKVAIGIFYTIKATKQGYTTDSTTLFVTDNMANTNTVLRLRPTKNIAPPLPKPPKPPVIVAPQLTKLPIVRKPSENKAIALHTIYYDFGKTELNAAAATTLDSIAQTLLAHPTLVVELGSHTDSKGNAAANKKLSDERSLAALQYLLSRGVEVERLVPVGYGAAQPAAPNEIDGLDNEAGRALNRRTEFRILDGRALGQ